MRVRNVLELFPKEHPFKRSRRRRERIVVFLLVLCYTVTSVQAFLPIGQRSRRSLPSKRYYNTDTSEPRQQERVRQSSDATTTDDDTKQQKNPGWVSNSQLEELKDSVDIVTVVESYGLERFAKRQGDNTKATAVCPFHNDRNPSLNIDGSRRLYKCFACGAGGDVFNFVREYSKVKTGQEISFYQAVRRVNKEFGDGTMGDSTASGGRGGPRLSDEERQALQAKKDRILLANAAAATFYTECLTQPFGGRARSHLQSRGLPALAARSFALGYAPDAYYGKDTPRSQWGVASLVNRLRDLEFTPQEILDAGLAIRTKKEAPPLSSVEVQSQPESNVTQPETLDYSQLMDRFRGRLVVPIFDAMGKRVLGFGGRILSTPEEESVVSNFKAPKYLNSPESAVFQKKNILFNENLARDAARKASEGKSSRPVVLVEGYMDAIALWGVGVKEVVASMGTALSSEQLASAAKLAGAPGGRVVLCLDSDEAGQIAVERLCGNGMLAETTSKLGVEIFVATLPRGLKDPAEFIESREGVSVDVATMFRTDVMDAATDWTDWYIQRLFGEYDSTAMRGRPGSFSDIFERVAGFLATSMGPADRTKRAYEVAGSLARIIAEESNTTEVSSAVRFQLESDLIDLASRTAEARDAVQRRSESVNGQSPSNARTVLSSLSRGQGPSSDDDDLGKLSFKALEAASASDSKSPNNLASASRQPVQPLPSDSMNPRQRAQTRRRTFREKDASKAKPLTPHFTGFQFARQSDMDWLGIPKEKWKQKRATLTLGTNTPFMTPTGRKQVGKTASDPVIYFNSNVYHGNQFLSNEAVEAGYDTSRAVNRNPSSIENGVASLVEQDTDSMALAAEDALLRVLVLHGAARTTAKNMLEARNAVHSGISIEWSCEKKQWLFSSLVQKVDKIPPTCRQPQELRSFLASLPDVPVGALQGNTTAVMTLVDGAIDGIADDFDRHGFQSEDGHGDSFADPNTILSDEGTLHAAMTIPAIDEPGNVGSVPLSVDRKPLVPNASSSTATAENSLDQYFVAQDDFSTMTVANGGDSVSGEVRGELCVQELLATLLWATTSKRASAIQKEFISAFNAMNETTNVEDGGDNESITTTDSNGEAPMEKARLESNLQRLAADLRETNISLQQLAESAKRITSRLMDQGAMDGLEGRVSISLQEEIAAKVDAHLQSIVRGAPTQRDAVSDRDMLLGDSRDDEPYEDTLEQMEEEWGEWWDEDFKWSPDRAGPSQSVGKGYYESNDGGPDPMDILEDKEDTFDQDMEQMDRDWKAWEDG